MSEYNIQRDIIHPLEQYLSGQVSEKDEVGCAQYEERKLLGAS